MLHDDVSLTSAMRIHAGSDDASEINRTPFEVTLERRRREDQSKIDRLIREQYALGVAIERWRVTALLLAPLLAIETLTILWMVAR